MVIETKQQPRHVIGVINPLEKHLLDKYYFNYDYNIKKPVRNVSIIMATYNEEKYIEKAVKSIYSQRIIDRYQSMFEFILVDSGSKDKTVSIAKKYVDKVIQAPRGKLTARNIATKQSKGGIIVSVDGDCFYPQGWLNTLLKPFNHKDKNNRYKYVAINGSTYDYNDTQFTLQDFYFTNIFYPNRLFGRNSAYYKDAFNKVGGFNEKVNQFNVITIMSEEELGFGNRMAKLGKIRQELNAGCIHYGLEKAYCRITPNKKECKQYNIYKDRF